MVERNGLFERGRSELNEELFREIIYKIKELISFTFIHQLSIEILTLKIN
jgi:hypothetical protein